MLCETRNSNLSKKESYIRLALGLSMAIASLYMQSLLITMMAVAFILNAFFQKCYFYELLGINKELKKQNGYLFKSSFNSSS